MAQLTEAELWAKARQLPKVTLAVETTSPLKTALAKLKAKKGLKSVSVLVEEKLSADPELAPLIKESALELLSQEPRG